jgi:hypothetical protein
LWGLFCSISIISFLCFVDHFFVFLSSFLWPLLSLSFFYLWFLIWFNAIFSNISAISISWRPVLVVEEAGVPEENYRPWTSKW